MQLTNDQIYQIKKIAVNAGEIILEYYLGRKDKEVKAKQDNSEVTAADIAANKYLNESLTELFPNIPIVSEENSVNDNLKAAQNSVFFLNDPLDGTRAFINKSDEFTVNIALIKDYKPVFGVIYLPVSRDLYFTDADFKAYKNDQPIKVASRMQDYRVICTKREPEKSDVLAYLTKQNLQPEILLSVSSSLKFCLIAEGKADIYPRKVSICGWDIAAGHAIVNAASGLMTDYEGREIQYKFIDDFKVPEFIVTGNIR
ncbi:MAG: 3'(2'),5'-bisphosphate nucleotidase CysQ [Rickettsiales bacterium]|jgi:3'(2'), 5'-bisphosphate nucleotidase|nr:3'(2'),5'-bisphosphate nucleotidase CysQ [Rickettsiales bacterium]